MLGFGVISTVQFRMRSMSAFELIMIIILMIALSMTSDVISERSRFKQDAKYNIAKSWTGEQKLIGLILVIPYHVE